MIHDAELSESEKESAAATPSEMAAAGSGSLGAARLVREASSGTVSWLLAWALVRGPSSRSGSDGESSIAVRGSQDEQVRLTEGTGKFFLLPEEGSK